MAFAKICGNGYSLVSQPGDAFIFADEMCTLTIPRNDFNQGGLHVKDLLPSADWLFFTYKDPVLSIEMG